MSKIYLLDANVLIPLADENHVSHHRARAWFQKGTPFATCPITQGALFRYHLREIKQSSISSAKRLLERIVVLPNHHFWPDDASYEKIPVKGVTGYRQVTDAYLVLLAAEHKGVLATMDEALAAIHPETFLVPRHS
ncbi:MAG: TA system VapC family ribonuclease toxin [Bryobacteraceae bacterium]